MKSIEILGPWLKNKGDELTLHSVGERVQPNYALCVSTDLKITDQKNLPELLQLTSLPGKNEISEIVQRRSLSKLLSVSKRGILIPLLPQSVLRKMGYINSRHLVALLDCSGYAYGDKWPPRRMIERTQYYRMLRKKNVKIILMPQALGPFDDPDIQLHAKELFDQFDFIFPREEVSERFVLDLGVKPEKLSTCPDITHLLQGHRPDKPEEWKRRVAIVPNARMLDKTDTVTAKSYLDILVTCIERIRANNLEPVVLIHEANDDTLVSQLTSRLDNPPMVFDEDGITSKGYLGECYANIGHRYHSLISSLSQATPSLASSWAHKYEALFAEYGCKECLVSTELEEDVFSKKIDDFLAPERNKELRDLLSIRAGKQKEKVEKMWQQVESIISQP